MGVMTNLVGTRILPLFQPHCFYAVKTEHTADRAHPTQVLEPSTYRSLHSTLTKRRKRRVNVVGVRRLKR